MFWFKQVVSVLRVATTSVPRRAAAMSTIAAATVLLCGIGAPGASADDTVWLNNGTSVPFTQEAQCLFVDSYSSCGSADNGAWLQGAVLAAGQINPGIYAVLQAYPGSVNFATEWSPNGGSDYFTFDAVDPSIGAAYVTCTGSVPGFSCSVSDGLFGYLHQVGSSTGLGASPVQAGFWSGLIPVSRGGVALVPVSSYSTERRGSARERVVLRGAGGGVIGRGEQTVRYGQNADVEVPLSAAVARSIAKGTSRKVTAAVTDAAGTAGTGQTTTLTLTKLTPALAKQLHLPAGLAS